MKRFYCTVCKKMKRTQKWPANISSVHDEVPTNRIGTCNYHGKVTRTGTPIAKAEHQANLSNLSMTGSK